MSTTTSKLGNKYDKTEIEKLDKGFTKNCANFFAKPIVLIAVLKIQTGQHLRGVSLYVSIVLKN